METVQILFALAVALVAPFQLGRDIKAYYKAKAETGKAKWPQYQGWRAWLFPLADVLGVASVLFVVGVVVIPLVER